MVAWWNKELTMYGEENVACGKQRTFNLQEEQVHLDLRPTSKQKNLKYAISSLNLLHSHSQFLQHFSNVESAIRIDLCGSLYAKKPQCMYKLPDWICGMLMLYRFSYWLQTEVGKSGEMHSDVPFMGSSPTFKKNPDIQ